MKGSHGKMKGTRRKLKKDEDVAPNDYLKDFVVGEKAQINVEPSSHSGMPDPRFQGRVVKIVGKEGSTCVTKVDEGNKEKKLKIKPVHLKKIGSQD